MMRRYLNRMMRPRDLVLQFHRVAGEPEGMKGVTGILTTSQQLRPDDMDRIRSLDPLEMVDGQVVKIPRR